MKLNDTARLDFLQSLNDRAEYTGRAVLRWSSTGRGWRLHETSRENGVANIRLAIDRAMEDENDS